MLWDRHQADELPHINMTPMVDVILCLLVFFMAATRLYDWEENEFAVNVPEVAEAGPLTAAPDDLILTIVKPGQVAIGTSTRAYDLPALGTVLRKSRDVYVDQGVIIRGDASLNYQDLADVLSVCDAAGIRNVRLPVRPRDGSTATATARATTAVKTD
jgi:biopolymer transport protein ExbD